MADIESNLTTAQAQQIHGQRTAVKDRFYTDEFGTRYLGLADGRLEKIPTIRGDITGDLEVSVLSNINDRTPQVLTGQVDANTAEVIRLEADKVDTCTAIAFSVAL